MLSDPVRMDQFMLDTAACFTSLEAADASGCSGAGVRAEAARLSADRSSWSHITSAYSSMAGLNGFRPRSFFKAIGSAGEAVRAGMSDEWDAEPDGGCDHTRHEVLAARSLSSPTKDPPSAPGWS